ncbi:MAG: hypothetical protein INH41_18720 [Myxococcaceae bacterium]|jgi:hypothetical protein|nr:hypothetical protein [Myxococcaceae bacterium]
MFVRAYCLSLLLLASACEETRPAPVADAGGEPDGLLVLSDGGVATEPRRRPSPEGKRRPKSILLAEVREVVGWRVADGYLSREDIVDLALDAADGRESLRRDVEKLVDDELAAHREREAGWRFLTDPDRLARAFGALERQGVLARERFSDCRKCGLAEMKDLRESLQTQGRRFDGYAFFTDQDADGVSESGELVLEFGSFRDTADSRRRVADRLEQALRAEGLSAVRETDEDDEPYLVLVDLTWQRRRFTKPPAR